MQNQAQLHVWPGCCDWVQHLTGGSAPELVTHWWTISMIGPWKLLWTRAQGIFMDQWANKTHRSFSREFHCVHTNIPLTVLSTAKLAYWLVVSWMQQLIFPLFMYCTNKDTTQMREHGKNVYSIDDIIANVYYSTSVTFSFAFLCWTLWSFGVPFYY